MDALRQEDDWRRVAEEHFSVDNIRKSFARSPPFSTQDADGWRPREHVAFFRQSFDGLDGLKGDQLIHFIRPDGPQLGVETRILGDGRLTEG